MGVHINIFVQGSFNPVRMAPAQGWHSPIPMTLTILIAAQYVQQLSLWCQTSYPAIWHWKFSKVPTIRVAWPRCKGDTHKSRKVNISMTFIILMNSLQDVQQHTSSACITQLCTLDMAPQLLQSVSHGLRKDDSCIRTHAYARTYICMRMYTRTHVYARTRTHAHVPTHMHVYPHARIRTHAHVHTNMHV